MVQPQQENLPYQSYNDTLNNIVCCSMMQALPSSRSMKAAWLYDPKVWRTSEPADQPQRNLQAQRPLCVELEINGIKAYTLLDTGCTTDTISPEMAYLAKADHVNLKEQLNLQLGAKGSRTVINYGARPRIRIGSVDEVYYMDVVDIDRYDAVLGTTFCMAHNVVLDMKKRKVWVDGQEVPTYEAVQESELLAHRHENRQSRIAAHLQSGVLSQSRGPR